MREHNLDIVVERMKEAEGGHGRWKDGTLKSVSKYAILSYSEGTSGKLGNDRLSQRKIFISTDPDSRSERCGVTMYPALKAPFLTGILVGE